MSDYSKATDFAAKDDLTTGDPDKIVKGAEIDTEFNNISTAISSKADRASPALTGTATAVNLTVTGTLTSTGTVDFGTATITDAGTVTTIDINGGTVDGTPIGLTTPSTGAFSTLSATGDTTLDDVYCDINHVKVYTEFNPSPSGTYKTRIWHSPSFGLDIQTRTQDDSVIKLAMHIQEATGKVFLYDDLDLAGDMVVDGDTVFGGIMSGMVSDNSVANPDSKMTTLTQAQYDALTPDADTMYFIVG